MGSIREKAIEVSVIIPAFNAATSICACLDALSTQKTDRKFEVIVVDDASTDDLSFITAQYAGRLRLQLLRLQTNSGPGAARNAGARVAAGEILLFTDSDCVPAPDWLEKMLAPMTDPGLTGVKGVYQTFQNDLWARLAQLEFEERYEKLASHGEIDFIDTYCGAYRKSVFLAAGGFNPELRQNEDVDLAFRIKKAGARFLFAPEARVAHTHREGWLAYARLKYWRGYWRMRIYRQHLQKAGNDTYTPWTLKVQLALLTLFPVALFSKQLRFYWKAIWLGTCIPLARLALPERPVLAILTPLFCLIRGLALLSGMAAGLTSWWKKTLKT
ncbi:MAG TPA: glycosyltransferase [Candidatus Ozemobacteraceae bacterium]|nr:glycosyltransferase [Candidatus Ozemobacteraceae bacterium]